MDTTFVQLTASQVDLLRGVLYEYYSNHNYSDETEKAIHADLEILLAEAEDSFLSEIY
jgi:hypothetical protein